ncbi:MAG TPA: transposase [Bacteroidales bacterium]|nr:transposase [Bacteroidales bacterium]
MMEGVISHVVFTVKNSRYDLQRIKRKKSVGLISPTFPFFENEQEDLIIKILCDVASELGLNIKAFNFCGDHVHTIVVSDNPDISKKIGLWKGKSAYLYNVQSQSRNPVKITQNLWAKSYYQKTITSKNEQEKQISYINNNRKKHGLAPLSKMSANIVHALIQDKDE